MRTKLLFAIFVVLTICETRSQTDTSDVRPIVFPFWMVKEIALDLEEKDRLQAVEKDLTLAIANLQNQKATLVAKSREKSVQISLLQEVNQILKTQYEAEKIKKKGSGWFIWTLATVAAFGSGFVLGSF